jgi:hypothetical protein
MNWKYVVSGGLFLVLVGLVGAADYVSTSIATDGSFLLASSGQTNNGTYVSRIMAADASEITRSMTGDDSLATDISVTSSGPILVSDYASGRRVTALPDTIACVFTKYVLDRDPKSELYSMGILSKRRYAKSRVAGSGLTGGMEVNGSGMMSFGSYMVGNITMRSSGFVSGNMTIHDFVNTGGNYDLGDFRWVFRRCHGDKRYSRYPGVPVVPETWLLDQ